MLKDIVVPYGSASELLNEREGVEGRGVFDMIHLSLREVLRGHPWDYELWE